MKFLLLSISVSITAFVHSQSITTLGSNPGFRSSAIGYNTISGGSYSYSNGFYSTASGYSSFAVGRYITTSGSYSMTLGSGYNNVNRLSNTIANSLMIGFSSNLPTLFVGPSDGIGTTGNVGVGTTTPGAKLTVLSTDNDYSYAFRTDVDKDFIKAISVRKGGTDNFLVYGNGTLYAREIFVKMGTLGDFVFDDDYNLLPLDQVESYIKENHHLPNIPSAEEVRNNDLNVGEMENLILQKVEELTLYVIEQDKKIKELEEANSALKSTVESISNK